MAEPPGAGPRTIAARALLTRAPGDRRTMRGVAMAEFAKLLARIEEEAAAGFRADLEWAIAELERCDATRSPEVAAEIARIKQAL